MERERQKRKKDTRCVTARHEGKGEEGEEGDEVHGKALGGGGGRDTRGAVKARV